MSMETIKSSIGTEEEFLTWCGLKGNNDDIEKIRNELSD